MKRFAILISLFAFGICPAEAQSHLIDSLKEALLHHPQKDTIRLNILNDLSYYFSSSDPDKGIETAHEAIALGKSLYSFKKLASAYNNLGVNYNTKGEDSMAIESYKSSMTIKKEIGDQKGIAVSLHNIGLIYFNKSDYEKALENQLQAFNLFNAINYEKGETATLNSIGVIYLYIGEYPQSLEYYLKALKISERSNDLYNQAIAFTNIGLVYDHSSDFGKAMNYYQRAEKIFKKEGKLFELQNVLTNMGNTSDNEGNPGKALEYYQRASEINKQLGNKRGIASGLANSGIVYLGIKDYSNALKYLNESLKVYKSINENYGIAVALSSISKSYFKAPAQVLATYAISESSRFARSIELQQEALKIAQSAGLTKVESDAWENLSDIYQAAGKNERALESYKKYIMMRDSVMNEDKKSEITRLTMQYDFDKKQMAEKNKADKEQARIVNALERQKIINNVIAIGAILIIIAAGLIFIFYDRKRKAIARAKEAELRAEMVEGELKALRAQMNPHFIFNSLNSISDFLHKNDFESANHYLMKFSKLIRTILENSEYKEISLEDDLAALDAYLQLESVRMNHKFTYEMRVDDSVDQVNTMISPLILQPFVENSIWHGISGKDGRGKISIEIKREGEMLLCAIEDNGAGMKQESGSGKSLGMSITGSRIELINKLRKTNVTFNLVPVAEGTRVELKLPLILSF